jgi:hypothetical protein
MTSYMFPHPHKDNTMNTSTEPVAIGGAIQALILAAILVLRVFNIVDLTPEQENAVIVGYLALVGVITAAQRSRVTPV